MTSDCTCRHPDPDHRGLYFEGKPGAWRCIGCAVCGYGHFLHTPYQRHLHNIDHDFQQCPCKGDNN